jgi:hypothetical protein
MGISCWRGGVGVEGFLEDGLGEAAALRKREEAGDVGVREMWLCVRSDTSRHNILLPDWL